jgi:putative DNA primase/helicase
MITDTSKYGGTIDTLKAITGQDPIRLERKHIQQSENFIFEGLVVMASNESLATTDYTSGLERRRVTVPFERRIPEDEKLEFYEADGEQRLHDEIPGLINWLLDMSVEEMEQIISHPPKRITQANVEAMRDSNPIADWVMENCIPAQGEWTQIGVKNEIREHGEVIYKSSGFHLYPNYLQWCLQNGRQALSVKRFRSHAVDVLKNSFKVDVIEVKRNIGMGIVGIRIRDTSEDSSW